MNVTLPIALAVLAVIAGGVLGARSREADDDRPAAAVAWQPGVAAIERARASALSGMLRARADGSAERVLDACERFAALGDGDVVSACLRVARDLADRRDHQRKEKP